MAITTDTLIFEFKVKDDASKAFDAWGKRLNGLEKQLKKSINFSGLGGSLKTALINPFLGAFDAISAAATKVFSEIWSFTKSFVTDSVKAFMSYEDQLALVGKTTGLAGEELEALGDEIRDLARPIGSLKAENLLEVAQVAGQLGVATKDIGAFAVSIGKGTIALDKFGGSTEKLATHMAKSQVIFKLGTKNTDNMLSSLDALAKSTSANELEISNFNLKMGQFNAEMGLTYQQSSALGALFVSSGNIASKAATQYGAAYKQLSTSSKGLAAAIQILQSGTDGGAAAIAQLESVVGRSRESFSSLGEMIKFALGQDAFSTMNLIVGEWGKIEQSTENMAKGIDRASLGVDAFGATGKKSMTSLAEGINASSDAVNNFGLMMDTSNEKFEEANSHLTSYEAQVAKTSEKFKQLGSIWNDILLTFGEPTVKALGRLLEPIIEIGNKFADWVKNNEQFQIALKAVVATLEQIASGVITSITEHFEDWVYIIGRDGAGAWDDLKAKIAEAWGEVVKFGETIRDAIDGIDPVDVINGFQSAVKIVGELIAFVGNLGSTLRELSPLVDLFKAAWEGVSIAINAVKAITQPFFDGLVEMVYAFQKAMSGDIFGGLKDGILAINTTLDGMFTMMKKAGLDAVDALAGAVLGKLMGAFDKLSGKVKGIWDGLKNAIKGTEKAANDAADSIDKVNDSQKEVAKEGYEQSVWPELQSWIGKNVEETKNLAKGLTAVTSDMVGIESAAVSALQSITAATRAQQLAVKSAGLAPITPVTPATPVTPGTPATPSTPVQRKPIGGTSGAIPGSGNGQTRQQLIQQFINFTGQNVIDESSKNRFARELGLQQQTLANAVISA